jgi:hypothetical protein
MSKNPPSFFGHLSGPLAFAAWPLWNGAQLERAGNAALPLLWPTKMSHLLLEQITKFHGHRDTNPKRKRGSPSLTLRVSGHG